MRYGDKCKTKGAKMKNNSPAVMQLINNANFLLNVRFPEVFEVPDQILEYQ